MSSPAEHLDWLPWRQTVATYNRDKFGGDLRAAVNVALLAFPQGIAYALIAGLPLHYGLYGSIIASFIGGILGKSHFVVLGPTNATAVLLLSAVAGMTATVDVLVVLPIITILSGIFLLAVAFFHLSGVIRFISRTVITGYITAAALLIILNQVRKVLGFRFEEGQVGDTFLSALYYTVLNLPKLDWGVGLFSLLCFVLFFSLKRFTPKLPNVALVLIVASALGMLFVSVFGVQLELLSSVSLRDWKLTLPSLDPSLISLCLSAALAIALLSVLEGNSIGKSLAARSGQRFDSNQEIFSMGIANVGCGLFSGIPASGSLTRSALNVSSGARTSFASLYSGLILLLILVLAGQWVAYIPQPALAVVIIMIGVSLINFAAMRFVVRATFNDRLCFAVTLGGGLLFGLDIAIYGGTLISILLFLRQASIPEMVEYEFNPEGRLIERRNETHSIPQVSIVHVEGDLFFGASDLFRDQIRRICDEPNLKIIILRLRNARHLDASSAMALDELLTFMQQHDRMLIVCGLRKNVFRVFLNTGLDKRIGRDRIFPDSVTNPVQSTAKAVRKAKELLGGEMADVTLYTNPSAKKGS